MVRTLFDWRGEIDRGRYASFGLVLALLKVNLDRLVAGLDGRYWSPLDYWTPGTVPIDELAGEDWPFYVGLVAVALPFVWVGVALTLKRLHDAALPVWPLVLFFVPFVNILLFLLLSVLPSGRPDPVEDRQSRLERVIPKSAMGSAAFAVGLSSFLALGVIVLGAQVLETYGWGIFVGAPFTMGLVAAVVHGYHEPRNAGACINVALLSVSIAGGLLLGLAIEGAICLLMAAPLAMVLAALGGLVGCAVQRRRPAPANGVLSVAVLALPLLVGAEAAVDARPKRAPVTTSIVVDAPPQVVWRHVVSFSELPPPKELVFRLGIAYPTEARIDGRGVGAVRRCRFSTGDFVEPITVWSPPRRLAFGVDEQPAPMRELSPWGAIRPPHLDGFLLSRRGEFRLVTLPGGRTLLRGTTWYENRMWPAGYWRLWSDTLIRKIHLRVLQHVAALAEAEAAGSAGSGLTNF